MKQQQLSFLELHVVKTKSDIWRGVLPCYGNYPKGDECQLCGIGEQCKEGVVPIPKSKVPVPEVKKMRR